MRNKGIFLFEIFTILLFLVNIFFLRIKDYYVITGVILLLILFFLFIFKVGFVILIWGGCLVNKVKWFNSIKVKIPIFLILVFYIFIYYLSGLYFGFLNNNLGLRLDIIIRNILPLIVIIVFSEIFRFRSRGRK